MAGSGKAWLRRQAYVEQRLAGGVAGFMEPESPSQTHRRLLGEYRQRQVDHVAPPGGGAAGLGPVAPPGPNWEPIGPLAVRQGQAATRPVVAGRVPDLVVSEDGQRVYVATSNGGVWRSADAGRTWQPLSDEFDVDPERQAVDSLATGAIALVDGGAVERDLLYVGTGEGHQLQPASPTFFGVGMLRSDDGGTNWIREGSSPDLTGRSVFALAVDPADTSHVLAATNRGVYRRGPGAAGTWQREPLPAPAGAASMITGLTVGTRGGATAFYASTAAGRPFSWTAATGWTALPALPAPTVGRTTLACSATDPPVLYALASIESNNRTHGVHRLDDGAATWQTVSATPANLLGDQGWYDQAIAVDPTDPDFVYVGGSTEEIAGEYSAALYRCRIRSVGTGFTSTSTPIGGSVHADVHALYFRPGSSRELWVGCDGGVFATHDARLSGTAVFASRNTGLGNLSLIGLGHHPREEAYAFCGAQDCGGLRYLGHEAWDHQASGDGGASVVHWHTPTRLLNVIFNSRVRRLALDGARYDEPKVSPTLAAGERVLFYPPLVGTPPSGTPADADVVALGAERPYVSTTFGDDWVPLPARGPMGGSRLTALAFASATRLWAGWEDGHVARYDFAAAAWTRTDNAVPGGVESRPVTGIAVDPADGTGGSVWITLGGAPGGGPRVRRCSAGTWTVPAGATPAPGVEGRLLDSQHNAIVVDPAHPTHVYVGADIGVWRSPDSGKTWRPFSANLPDSAVLDLDLLPSTRLLRATVHGRGVYEVPLDTVQQGVELVLRANALDQRRRDARADVATPGDLSRTTRLDESPDIYVDAPDEHGRYVLRGDRVPTIVELVEQVTGTQVLASVPGTLAMTRVHVIVRNRGVTRTDDVRVTVLVGPRDQPLPASYREAARGGTLTPEHGWQVAGTTTANGLRAGRHVVVTVPLSSEVLPPAATSAGQDYLVLALLHHPDDPFPTAGPAGTTDPVLLVTRSRHAAMKAVTVTSAQRRAAPAGGSGLLVPMSTTLLAHRQLSRLITDLEAKVATPAAAVHPVERRVLAMAKAGRTSLESGVKPSIGATVTGDGIGTFALLGALGYELPSYTSAFLPGGSWVAETLRRGTGDPHMSRVAVSGLEVPLNLAKALVTAPPSATKEAVQAFAAGMLAGAASGVLLAPQLSELLAQDTNADWSPASSSRGARALEHHVRRLYLGGPEAPLPPWLPTPGQVPEQLWQHYVRALEGTFGLPGTRLPGFGPFEAEFDAGYWPDPARLGRGYGLLLDDARVQAWGFWPWFGLLSPIVLMPSLAFACTRATRHGKAFLEGGGLDERAVFEALALAMGLGALAPFLYSMLLWSQVDEHTEAFVTSLVMGLARLGLVTAALATSGDEDQGAAVRWGALFPPLAAADAYASFRGALDPRRHPGNAKVFALQTLPALTGLTTLGWLGLARVITGDAPSDTATEGTFWGITLSTAVVSLCAVGIPAALALSHGRGWRSWFLRDTTHLPLLSSVATAGVDPLSPTAQARVFAPTSLVTLPGRAADLDEMVYPAGMRPLVRFWWEGDGELTVRSEETGWTFRLDGGEDRPVPLPGTATATTMVEALLGAGLAGLKAEVIGRDEPALPLPRPNALADHGDDAPHEAAEALRTSFVRVPRSRRRAIVVRQAPRVQQSTTAGRTAAQDGPWLLVPPDAAVDDLGTGLRDAADLAAMLITAAAPTFGRVRVDDGRPALPDPEVKEVRQVFRKWNLDERRLDEWRSLMTGHGGTAPPADPVRGGQNVMIRRQPDDYAAHAPGRVVAEAMGWLPLWRAWLRIAADPSADVASDSQAGNPEITLPGQAAQRVRNRELTDGVRFLLDLGDA